MMENQLKSIILILSELIADIITQEHRKEEGTDGE